MRITRVYFKHFKALEEYAISLKRTNVLVGPNNAGKSTVLDGFRALQGVLRYVRRRKAGEGSRTKRKTVARL